MHGNAPALEAALADLAGQDVHEVLLGGDLVGRGPEGSRILAMVRERGWPSVRGNHEEYLLAFREGRVPPDWHGREEWAAAGWMARELSADDERSIATLPFRLRSTIAPAVQVVHGSPRSVSEGIGGWTTEDQLDRHLEGVEGGVLACGHTHRAGSWRRAGGLVVNVGAVGLPFNGDRRAQYVVLHETPAGWTAEFRRVGYDVERTLRIYDSSGFLEAGGVTAKLLRLELQHAAPFLVPFLRWVAAEGRPATSEQIAPFLERYDPAAHLAKPTGFMP